MSLMSSKEEHGTIIKLNSDQQKILVGLLKEQLPETIRIYGMVKNVSNKNWPYFEIYVDQWPRYCAILLLGIPDICDGYNGKFIITHGQDSNAILKLLFHPGITDWTKELVFDIPPHFQDVLLTLLPDGAQLQKLFHGQYFVVSPRTMKFSFSIKVADVSISEIRQEDVPLIAKNRLPHPDTQLFLTRLVNSNLPTICLRLQTGEPVAYAFTHFDNLVGMLHVSPNHRRQGLAKVCISFIVKHGFKEEEFVGARIAYHNEASRKLFISCGFVSLPKPNDYMAFTYYPPK